MCLGPADLLAWPLRPWGLEHWACWAQPPAYADKIDDAAKVLSEKSYPFLKEIDWTSDVYGKLPTQNALDVLKAIDPHFEGKPCNATPLQGS